MIYQWRWETSWHKMIYWTARKLSRVARIFWGGGHKLVQLGGIYTEIYISIYIQILQEGHVPPVPPSGYALAETHIEIARYLQILMTSTTTLLHAIDQQKVKKLKRSLLGNEFLTCDKKHTGMAIFWKQPTFSKDIYWIQ